MDLEDIRLKEPDELTDEEGKFLKENADDLTDEEKETFKDQLKEEEKEEKGFAFKSEEEFKSAVSKAVTDAVAASKKAEGEEAEEKKEEEKKGKEEDFVDPTWKAPNWNEAAKRLFPVFRDRIIGEIQTLNAKQRDRLAEINEEFDKEIEDLAKIDKTIPAKGTAERDEFEAELARIGAENKSVTNMTGAYGLWKAKGGKIEIKEEEEQKKEEGTPVEGTEVSSRQKELAKKVSRGGAEKKTYKEKSYARIASRTLGDLVAEEAEKLES